MNKFKEFQELMEEWETETGMYSISRQWEKHRNFELLYKFEDAVSFACLYLKKDPHRAWSLIHWSLHPHKLPPALPAYYAGRVSIYKEVYIYWALKEGYLLNKFDPEEYWMEDKYGNRMQ